MERLDPCVVEISPFHVQAAIAGAKSLEEVKQLEMQLMAGQVPRPQQEAPPPLLGAMRKEEEQVVEEDEEDEAEENGIMES